MALVRKYEFDLSFDRDALAALPEPEAEAAMAIEPVPEPEPEPTYSVAELEAARLQARVEGRIEGETAALAGFERRLADAAEHLNAVLHGLAASGSEVAAILERQAAEAVLVLVRKLFPALTERAGTGEIEAVIEEALRRAVEEPRLVLRCAATLRDGVETLAQGAAAKAGFEGRLVVVGDARLAQGDCRVEWAEGGIERRPGRMIDAIESAVETGLAEFDRRHGLEIGATCPLEEATA